MVKPINQYFGAVMETTRVVKAKSWTEVPSTPGIFLAWLTLITNQGHLARKTIKCGACDTTFTRTGMDNKEHAKCSACGTMNRPWTKPINRRHRQKENFPPRGAAVLSFYLKNPDLSLLIITNRTSSHVRSNKKRCNRRLFHVPKIEFELLVVSKLLNHNEILTYTVLWCNLIYDDLS